MQAKLTVTVQFSDETREDAILAIFDDAITAIGEDVGEDEEVATSVETQT